MAPIRVLLVEDHDLVREGTRRLLERAEELEVIGEARDGDEAVRLALAQRPDVVVMDVRMPHMNGLEATRRLREQLSGVKILVLSAYEDDEYIFPLLEAGANGYLLKTTSGRELIRAINAVHAGQTVLDSQITGKVVGQLTGRQPVHRAPGMIESLTAREVEVLQAVADGLSNKQIGDALSISTYTVQVHLRNIFGKMGVGSRTEAVTYALEQGWVRFGGRGRGERA